MPPRNVLPIYFPAHFLYLLQTMPNSPYPPMQTVRPNHLATGVPSFQNPAKLVEDFKKLVESRWLSNRGTYVQNFEKGIKDYLEDPELQVVTVANGTLGLELALRAFDFEPGEVIVPSYTFVASVHSIVNSGLTPVMIDIDPNTLCISPVEVEKKINSKTRAVLPVHVYGNACDLEYFESLRSRNIKVIYDAAHAFGVKLNGVALGTHGDCSVFSFHATKVLNCGEGGAITTHDHDLAQKLCLLSSFGTSGETECNLLGTNAKLSEVHAMFGIHSLGQLNDEIQTRLTLDKLYRERLKGINQISCFSYREGLKQNGQYFPIFFENQNIRDALYNALKLKNIYSRKYFYPAVHQLGVYAKKNKTNLPITESAASRVLCLPLHGSMNNADIEFITDSIREIIKSL